MKEDKGDSQKEEDDVYELLNYLQDGQGSYAQQDDAQDQFAQKEGTELVGGQQGDFVDFFV